MVYHILMLGPLGLNVCFNSWPPQLLDLPQPRLLSLSGDQRLTAFLPRDAHLLAGDIRGSVAKSGRCQTWIRLNLAKTQ